MSPAFLYTAPFCIALLCGAVYADKWSLELHFNTFVTILCGAFLFVLICTIVHFSYGKWLLKTSKKKDNRCTAINVESWKIVLTIIVQCISLYIIHGASQTSSRAFIEEPIETITTALTGTKNMLEFARVNNVKGFVYLSSMEVYGSPLNDLKIDEKHGTNLDTMKVRSCYPESKRMCESLCASYSSEFGVPAKVVRLTQTFGPGVKYDDGRVFAEFARCAIERRNIVLKTKGETRRSYLYTEDAVNAILTVLYNGIPGQAYNAANEETYCSIYEMAKMVAGRFGDNSVKVLVEETNPEKLGYAPVLYMNLDTTKLHNLGWKAKFNLESMYQNMIEDMKINQKRY